MLGEEFSTYPYILLWKFDSHGQVKLEFTIE